MPEGHVGLDELFQHLSYGWYVREQVKTNEWVDVDKLAGRSPASPVAGDLDPLFRVPEFGLARRQEAFRMLFALRDRSVPTFALPGRDFVIALPAAHGGAGWYAWETVEPDHATYMFRPADDATRTRLLDWIRTPDQGTKRRDLLGDRSLQTELGFVTRVIHSDQHEELGRWRADLLRVVGQQERDRR